MAENFQKEDSTNNPKSKSNKKYEKWLESRSSTHSNRKGTTPKPPGKLPSFWLYDFEHYKKDKRSGTSPTQSFTRRDIPKDPSYLPKVETNVIRDIPKDLTHLPKVGTNVVNVNNQKFPSLFPIGPSYVPQAPSNVPKTASKDARTPSYFPRISSYIPRTPNFTPKASTNFPKAPSNVPKERNAPKEDINLPKVESNVPKVERNVPEVPSKLPAFSKPKTSKSSFQSNLPDLKVPFEKLEQKNIPSKIFSKENKPTYSEYGIVAIKI